MPALTVTVNLRTVRQVPPPAETRADARSEIHLDIEALVQWIGDRLPGSGKPLHAQRLGAATGIANALFILERDGHRWVLRRPPQVKNDPSASDTKREWRILCA